MDQLLHHAGATFGGPPRCLGDDPGPSGRVTGTRGRSVAGLRQEGWADDVLIPVFKAITTTWRSGHGFLANQGEVEERHVTGCIRPQWIMLNILNGRSHSTSLYRLNKASGRTFSSSGTYFTVKSNFNNFSI